MGYELDRLMRQFGVSSPTITYSGTPTAESQAYDAAFAQRMRETPQYLQSQFNTQAWQNTPQSQINTIKAWYGANPNPNPSDADVAALMNKYGLTNRDIYNATGNYWGNVLGMPKGGTTPTPPVTPTEPPYVPPVKPQPPTPPVVPPPVVIPPYVPPVIEQPPGDDNPTVEIPTYTDEIPPYVPHVTENPPDKTGVVTVSPLVEVPPPEVIKEPPAKTPVITVSPLINSGTGEIIPGDTGHITENPPKTPVITVSPLVNSQTGEIIPGDTGTGKTGTVTVTPLVNSETGEIIPGDQTDEKTGVVIPGDLIDSTTGEVIGTGTRTPTGVVIPGPLVGRDGSPLSYTPDTTTGKTGKVDVGTLYTPEITNLMASDPFFSTQVGLTEGSRPFNTTSAGDNASGKDAAYYASYAAEQAAAAGAGDARIGEVAQTVADAILAGDTVEEAMAKGTALLNSPAGTSSQLSPDDIPIQDLFGNSLDSSEETQPDSSTGGSDGSLSFDWEETGGIDYTDPTAYYGQILPGDVFNTMYDQMFLPVLPYGETRNEWESPRTVQFARGGHVKTHYDDGGPVVDRRSLAGGPLRYAASQEQPSPLARVATTQAKTLAPVEQPHYGIGASTLFNSNPKTLTQQEADVINAQYAQGYDAWRNWAQREHDRYAAEGTPEAQNPSNSLLGMDYQAFMTQALGPKGFAEYTNPQLIKGYNQQAVTDYADSINKNFGNSWRVASGQKPRFADGGEVTLDRDLNEMGRDYGIEDTAALGPRQVQAATPAIDPMQELLAKYSGGESPYARDLQAARAASDKATQDFYDMINRAANERESGAPDKSEMYFRLAAAFGAPTKFGSFGESLANASGAMAEHAKETRSANRAAQQQKQQLLLQGQQARMTGAKEDLNTLRTLTGEEMKDKRAIALEILKEQFKKGIPQSEAGKVAIDAGLVQGTPAYNDFVKKYISDKLESGTMFKQIMAGVAQGNLAIAQQGLQLRQAEADRKAAEGAKLTPTEAKMKSETEDLIGASDDALTTLKKAYALNPNTFDASAGDKIQRFALEQAGSKDQKLLNTREMENLLQEKALAGLKGAFGGNPTEGERKVMMDIQGISAKSIEERKQIMKNAFALLKTRRDRQQKRLDEIKSGKFRLTEPSQSAAPQEIDQ